MYHSLSAATPVAAATLPFTGLPVLFMVLAAFALLALGLALWRVTPRHEA